jgi:hypothetical protein
VFSTRKKDFLEKNQHTREEGNAQQAKTGIAQQSTGQQLPAEPRVDANLRRDVPAKGERHRETSLPQSDNETWGIP